jgi:uncharacterized protein
LAFTHFDAWTGSSTALIEPQTWDFDTASNILRRLDLPLRTLDALHLAIVQRIDAKLVTFDKRMADSARALGITVSVP